jgi:hypothetical protein
VRGTINSVTSYGDLVETHEPSNTASNFLLYLAAPSFLQVSDSLFLLFGVTPDGEDMTPPDLRQRVEAVMYSRRLAVQDPKQSCDTLLQAGFESLKLDHWLRRPPHRPASEFIALYDDALSKSGPPGTPEEVILIDPSQPVNYYNGRWTKLKKQTGRFLGRRSQTYGAQLWCYLEVSNGLVTRLLDFPLFETGVAAMDLFSPVPTWATRRWDAVGLRTMPNSSLISYIFPETQIDAECSFAAERMWLKRYE